MEMVVLRARLAHLEDGVDLFALRVDQLAAEAEAALARVRSLRARPGGAR